MPNPLQAVVTAAAIVIALLLGILIVDTIASQEDGIRMVEGDTVLLGETGEWVAVSNAAGYDETVVDSRGYAVNLTGASDSYVQTKHGIELAGDATWTISAGGRVDSEAASDHMTLVSADGRVVIEYDGANSQWSAWYYDEGSRDSYRVNVSAPNQPSSWAVVTAWSNGTHVAIYRDGTRGEVVNTTTSNIASASVESQNWNGRMDELRVFDDALSDATIGELSSDAVAPQPGTNRTARAMFDEPGRAEQRLFFAPTSLVTSNATYSGGFPGSEMDGASTLNDITGATDYQWSTQGPQIKPVGGGELEGAPVAYVTYQREEALASIVSAWASFAELAALLPLLLIILVIMGRMRNS